MKRLGFDLIVLGDPTAGKDTQAELLMKKYALKPVESGKYWRAAAKKKTSDGAWLRRTMSLGFPTPVVLMKKFLKDNLAKVPVNKDLIFIGNPRLKPEAQLLVKLMKEKKRNFFALYISLPVAQIHRRTKARPRIASEDAGVKNRIRYHQTQVSKTVAYFKSLNKLKLINGNQRISKVAADIQKSLNDYSRS